MSDVVESFEPTGLKEEGKRSGITSDEVNATDGKPTEDMCFRQEEYEYEQKLWDSTTGASQREGSRGQGEYEVVRVLRLRLTNKRQLLVRGETQEMIMRENGPRRNGIFTSECATQQPALLRWCGVSDHCGGHHCHQAINNDIINGNSALATQTQSLRRNASLQPPQDRGHKRLQCVCK
ncbi:hypothetical protein BJ165DRAFT_1077122 [Panaeolus papilionaceus]|nr:hypothetical protein BJ165DRAFT_1077122 [Panaeolus papilionaceus]